MAGDIKHSKTYLVVFQWKNILKWSYSSDSWADNSLQKWTNKQVEKSPDTARQDEQIFSSSEM